MRMILLIIFSAILPVAAQASDAVSLTSSVFVERTEVDARGHQKAVLHQPRIVTPGDRLVFMLQYRNTGSAPAKNFIVTNPMPQAVSFLGAPDDAAQVSVDGGRNWGPLGALRIRNDAGETRSATPEDVTHVRWSFRSAIPAGGKGTLSFRGIVR